MVTGDLAAGKTVALEAKGVLSKTVTDDTFDLSFSLYGITVLHKSGDLCSSSVLKVPKCPATAGPVAASGHLTIPVIAPKVGLAPRRGTVCIQFGYEGVGVARGPCGALTQSLGRPVNSVQATYGFKMTATSSEGELLFCVTSDVNINAASQDEVWNSLSAGAEVYLGTEALDHIRTTPAHKPPYTPPAFLRGGH